MENSKAPLKRLLELINKLSKVTKHKINIQKSTAFLYSRKKCENEIKKTIPLQIEPQIIRKINLRSARFVQCYKTLHREKDKLRNIPCSWTGRLNIINTTIFLKLIYRFDTIFFKTPAGFLKKQKKAHLIFIWKSKDLEEPNNLEKQKQEQPKIEGLTPNFKTV